MSSERLAFFDKYLLGAALLLAIMFGGNSAPGFWIDQAIQTVMILASAVVILRNPARPIDPRLIALIAAMLVAVALQLVPLPTGLVDPLQNIVGRLDPSIAPVPAFRPLSLGVDRTLEALVWVLASSMFAIAVTRISFEHAHGLVPIFLIGVLFHLVAGLMQYSASSAKPAESFLGFRPAAGFFANSNHFSALVFISIPLAFAYFFDRRRLSVFLAYLAAALLILLAVGSRAGVLIGLAITLLSSLILLRRGALGSLAALATASIAGIFAIGVWARLSHEGMTSASRSEFVRNTFAGILDNLPFGIGYGGFVNAYPAYEPTESIFRTYVNHAHNDFLELIFEGGLIAAALLAIALVVLVIRISETVRWPLHFACALSIFFLLLHSIVDYPLRTMAISASFSLMIAILFHHGTEEIPLKTRHRRKVRHHRTPHRKSLPNPASTTASTTPHTTPHPPSSPGP